MFLEAQRSPTKRLSRSEWLYFIMSVMCSMGLSRLEYFALLRMNSLVKSSWSLRLLAYPAPKR